MVTQTEIKVHREEIKQHYAAQLDRLDKELTEKDDGTVGMYNKKIALGSYKIRLEDADDEVSERSNEEHQVAIQEILDRNGKRDGEVEPFDPKIAAQTSQTPKESEHAELTEHGAVDFKELVERKPDLKVLELDINKAHQNWDRLLEMPKLEKVVLRDEIGLNLTANLKNLGPDQKRYALAELLGQAEDEINQKQHEERLAYANGIEKLANSGKKDKTLLYQAQFRRALIHLETKNFEELEKNLGGVFIKDGVNFSNLPDLVWNNSSHHFFKSLFKALPREGAYAPANEFFYKGLAKSIQAWVGNNEFEKGLKMVDLFLEKQQNDPTMIKAHSEEWFEVLTNLAAMNRMGVNIDQQVDKLREFVKDLDTKDLASSSPWGERILQFLQGFEVIPK